MTNKRRASSRGGLSRAVKRARVVIELDSGIVGGERVTAELTMELDWMAGASVNDVGAVVGRLRNALVVREVIEAELRPIDAPHLKPVRLRDTNVVGRSRLCDVPVPSAKVSRKHFRLRLAEGAFVIEDLGSVNRTWVNGERLEAPRSLANGDVISFGDVSFEFAELQ